jgi:hypothetical protein
MGIDLDWLHLTCVRPPQCGRKLVAVRLDYVMRSRGHAMDTMPNCQAADVHSNNSTTASISQQLD